MLPAVSMSAAVKQKVPVARSGPPSRWCPSAPPSTTLETSVRPGAPRSYAIPSAGVVLAVASASVAPTNTTVTSCSIGVRSSVPATSSTSAST